MLHALHSTGLSSVMAALGMACPLLCTSQHSTWPLHDVATSRLDAGLNLRLLMPSDGGLGTSALLLGLCAATTPNPPPNAAMVPCSDAAQGARASAASAAATWRVARRGAWRWRAAGAGASLLVSALGLVALARCRNAPVQSKTEVRTYLFSIGARAALEAPARATGIGAAAAAACKLLEATFWFAAAREAREARGSQQSQQRNATMQKEAMLAGEPPVSRAARVARLGGGGGVSRPPH